MTKPVWQKDEDVANCTQCNVAFSLWVRRHHCRNCGRIFCSKCSSKLCIVAHENKHVPERVCDACYTHITTSRRGKKTNESHAKMANNKANNDNNKNNNNSKICHKPNDTSETAHRTIISESKMSIYKNENYDDRNAFAEGRPTDFSSITNIDMAAANREGDKSADAIHNDNKNNGLEATRENKTVFNKEANAHLSSTIPDVEDEEDVFDSYYEECRQEHEKMLHTDNCSKEREGKVSRTIGVDEHKGHDNITSIEEGRQTDANVNPVDDKLHDANSKIVLLKERLRKLREEKPFYDVGALYVDEVHYNSTTTEVEDNLERYERCNSIEEIIQKCFPLPEPVDNSVACLWQPVSTSGLTTSLVENSNIDSHNSQRKDLLDDVASIVSHVTNQLMKVSS